MRIILILLMSLFLSACSMTRSSYEPDKLIGTWVINHNGSEINYSIIEYQKNGDKCEISFELVNHLEVTMYWNKWQLENGIIHSTLHNTTSLLEFGKTIGDKIETLNENELFVNMVIPEGDFSTEFHYKNKKAESGQVCDVVRKVFDNKSKQEFNLYGG